MKANHGVEESTWSKYFEPVKPGRNTKTLSNKEKRSKALSNTLNKTGKTISTSKTGIAGVSLYKKSKRFPEQRYAACIRVENKHVRIGLFDTIEEAALARYHSESCLGLPMPSSAYEYLLKRGLIKADESN